MLDNTKISGKTAFISGATGGIGKATAELLASLGCNLFLTGTDSAAVSQLAHDLSSHKVKVAYKAGDLTSPADVRAIVESTAEAFEGIDILINSAGVFPYLDLDETTDADFDKVFAINLRAPFIFAREFSQTMRDRQWGRIVNIGSSSAYNGFSGTSAYCASKHALLGFSKSIHDELKKYNVRTFFISPSSTQSKMGLATKGQDYSTFLDPVDVAKYVAFAISFDSNVMAEEIFLKRMTIR